MFGCRCGICIACTIDKRGSCFVDETAVYVMLYGCQIDVVLLKKKRAHVCVNLHCVSKEDKNTSEVLYVLYLVYEMKL